MMKNIFILIIIIAIIIITVIYLISKYFEKKEVDSIIELMNKKSKEDKEIEKKLKECIKIINDNTKER